MTDLKPEDLALTWRCRGLDENNQWRPWVEITEDQARRWQDEHGQNGRWEVEAIEPPSVTKQAVVQFIERNTRRGRNGAYIADIETFAGKLTLSLLADRARMEKALRDLIECDDDARNPLQNGIGLIDCIDNVGQFYPSQHLDDCLKAARQALGASQ